MKTYKTSSFLNCISLMCLIAHCSALPASSNITFLTNTTLNIAGYWPSLCGLKGSLVVVYDTENGLQTSDKDQLGRAYDNLLKYILFTVDPDGKVTQVGSEVYTKGNFPFITAHPSSNMVIAVNGRYTSNSLYYHVGKLMGETINWITPQGGILYAEEGALASVSVNDHGSVIAAHHKENGKYGFYYCVGYFDQNSAKISWKNSINGLCNPQSYTTENGWTPRAQITNNGTVVIIYTSQDDDPGVFYSIGKINAKQSTIDWAAKGVKYSSCPCSHAALTVDPFGTVMEVHYITTQAKLEYRMGILHDNYIQWKDTVIYGSGSTPVIAFLNGTNYLYGEIHIAPNSYLYVSTIAFGVEVVSITYGTAVPNGKTLFTTKSADFDNTAPATVGKVWTISAGYSCTSTHSWNVSLHAGISVTAKVNYFFASASATAETSIDFTIGKSYTKSETFKWEEDVTVTIPPNAGKVSYSAAIYSVPHTIPFVATFKRGSFTWKETGSVYVTHGAIFTDIFSSNGTSSRYV